jgi:hypothetical protein
MNSATELELARCIVKDGPNSHLENVSGVRRFGQLWTYAQDEYKQLSSVTDAIRQYLELPAPVRPISIGIFGPPGCGKSFLVGELVSEVKRAFAETATLGDLSRINLTQIASTDELSSGLLQAVTAGNDKIPIIFIDEFDSDRAGSPWGWLSWFLAPMQDGVFRSRGVEIPIKRAICFFAGGTATRFADFGVDDYQQFRLSKGPDFVSRLRGYIDIQGPNADTYPHLRRAVVLHRALGGRTVDDALVGAMLSVGRFKHGVRSMEALFDMMAPGSGGLSLDALPSQDLTSMHADRGPLDEKSIGGFIGLSCGDSGSESGSDLDGAWRETSRLLALQGATVAYGGRPERELTKSLRQVGVDLPERLERPGGPSQKKQVVNFIGAWGDVQIEKVDEATQRRIEFRKVPGSRDTDLANWSGPDEKRQILRDAITYFRLRYSMSLACVARFAIAGRADRFIGRFPGVVEEILLALAMNQPVYIAGGFGPGARWAGVLLGLGRTWEGMPAGFEEDVLDAAAVGGVEQLFRPPSHRNLPLVREELISYFERRAIGTNGWPDNGLSADENRLLFETTDVHEVASLVFQGLNRRFRNVAGR